MILSLLKQDRETNNLNDLKVNTISNVRISAAHYPSTGKYCVVVNYMDANDYLEFTSAEDLIKDVWYQYGIEVSYKEGNSTFIVPFSHQFDPVRNAIA